MEEIKELIDLANKIKDSDLRKKVIKFLKDPSLSHPEFKKYIRTEIKEAKVYFSTHFGTVVREIYTHTITLANICIKVSETLKEFLKVDLNTDYLLAAALLHDIMKIYEWKVEENLPKHTGITLNHSSLAIAELYRRNFPEHLIHIIASHFGEAGPNPPRTAEAFLFSHLDAMLSLFEAHLSPTKSEVPIIVLDEKFLKELEKKTSN